jgi:hypothetical protein
LETTRTSTAGTRASVKDDVVSLPCEGVSRRERRLDRSDAAAHLIDALDADELPLGRGDQQHAVTLSLAHAADR